jgi:hypothetical protein
MDANWLVARDLGSPEDPRHFTQAVDTPRDAPRRTIPYGCTSIARPTMRTLGA